MAQRSIKRFNFVWDEADVCPLGSGSLAGSTLPIDREFTAAELGFSKVSDNALDSVSDRDFALDFLNACNVGILHLSKLSEELILWSTSEFDFIRIGDNFTTGSSLMPQKKNPDLAELIRAKAGKMLGNYTSLSTLLKSLPLSYNRDLQEDKPPVFSSFENYTSSLHLMGEMLLNTEFKVSLKDDPQKNDFQLATDLTDYLVQKGISFRKAHGIIGEVVKYAESNGSGLNQLSLGELNKFSELFDDSSLEILKIESSLRNKRTYGSPNPNIVQKQIDKWKRKLKD
jgi:argininosuccinate lyase